jgi:hypothetical protein
LSCLGIGDGHVVLLCAVVQGPESEQKQSP